MPKFNKCFKSGFTTIGNDIFKDKNLSLKERGLLATMFSLPDTWDFSIKGLASILNEDGEKTVRNTLKSLEQKGYLKRVRVYTNGKISDWEYFFYDHLDVQNGQVENLDAQKVHVQKEQLPNGNQLIKQELNTKEYISINNNKNKTTTVIDKHGNFVAEKENKTSKGFNQDRIIQANAIQIARINEAERNDNSSKEAIKYLTDSCNCFGIKQIEKINNLPDEDFEYLFNIAHDIVTCEGDSGLYNPKGYLSSQITKCIKAHT